jgi:hypothetical protein
MGLSARERQVLDSIEAGLASSDPRMAALLGRFTTLVSDEDMPAREQIPANSRYLIRRSRTRYCRSKRSRGRSWLMPGRLGFQRTAALIYVLVVLALVVTVVVLSGGSSPKECPSWLATSCPRSAPGSRPTAHGRPANRAPEPARPHPGPG